jgi:hypothetical protein
MTWSIRWHGIGALLLSVGLLACPVKLAAHSPGDAMAEAATHFLATLDSQQRARAQFEFTDEERLNWHFVPMNRAGLSFKEMQGDQQHLAIGLLKSALSDRGFSKAEHILALEEILYEMENNSPFRDPDKYHIFIFGEPSPSQTWGFRFEGHHLSVSITLVDGQNISTTPTFMGANPAHVKQGPRKGLRVLHAEEDLAKQLLASLSAQQRDKAVISTTAPEDIISLPGRDAMALEPVGLSAHDMNDQQRSQLMEVVSEYVNNFRTELAKTDLEKIHAAGIEKLTFAWAGGDETGQGSYYRIQGPSFIMEYDNTQDNANHDHVVWRDFANDFGADMLKRHYESVPHKQDSVHSSARLLL